ncbi:MAG: tetratricopeptide repeat protein [Alphaproteobacteria bacterium]
MKKIYPLLLISILAACQGGVNPIDAPAFLSTLEGPKVPTMEETLQANAKSAEQQGEWGTAVQIYKQLLDKDPDNTQYIVAMAESQRRTGDHDRAVALYDLALGKDATLLAAKEGKALALLSKGDFEQPVPLFEEVMKVDDKRWKTLNGLGILFTTRGMYKEAGQYFAKALEHSPGNTSIMNNKGLTMALDGDSSAAIDTLLQAGALAAGNGVDRKRIDMNLALVYAIAGRLEDARMVTETYYAGAQLNNNMGLYAHLAKDDQMAKAYLNTALTQSKVFYDKAWENLQYVNSGKSDDATVASPVELQTAPAAGGEAPLAVKPLQGSFKATADGMASALEKEVSKEPTAKENPAQPQ